ncbi:S-layer homology domain-containing protein [Demequina litorisediminis]|uniref:S-layer homology domain-containing protein n=1 Tax=Demequina litorisediminis TaxID=1849022 RepID=UPI0024E0C54F|nr:S-layer homology domain-containing protein [Demequina litorisediminis]
MQRSASRKVAVWAVITTMAVALVTVTPQPSQAATTGFRDVTGSHQFYREISWLTSKGITTGFADKSFRPNWEVSREAFAAFLYRLAGKPSVSLPGSSPFKDVSKSDKFYREIVWLDRKGISRGWSDGTFRPDEPISRSAMAAFLYRFKGSPSYSPPSSSRFKDMRTSSKFYKEVSWLASTGMTTGFADGTFRPYDGTSRAATAAFLFRGYGKSSYKAPTYVPPKVTWKPSEILATARSQVGYREPSFRNNKYNDWIGGSSAWCSVYVSWVFEAAGYPGYVPKEKYFDSSLRFAVLRQQPAVRGRARLERQPLGPGSRRRGAHELACRRRHQPRGHRGPRHEPPEPGSTRATRRTARAPIPTAVSSTGGVRSTTWMRCSTRATTTTPSTRPMPRR